MADSPTTEKNTLSAVSSSEMQGQVMSSIIRVDDHDATRLADVFDADALESTVLISHEEASHIQVGSNGDTSVPILDTTTSENSMEADDGASSSPSTSEEYVKLDAGQKPATMSSVPSSETDVIGDSAVPPEGHVSTLNSTSGSDLEDADMVVDDDVPHNTSSQTNESKGHANLPAESKNVAKGQLDHRRENSDDTARQNNSTNAMKDSMTVDEDVSNGNTQQVDQNVDKLGMSDSDESDDDLYLDIPEGAKITHTQITGNIDSHPEDFNASESDTASDKSDNVSSTIIVDKVEHDEPANLDLATSIKGMYRILDLIVEQGSGGLVDKIIIAQDSLQAFVNTISPRAYVSLTKVDFKTLDMFVVKPIGFYGSKEEIVRFLVSIEVADDELAEKLLEKEDVSKPTLRSGLYIVKSINSHDVDEKLHVIYWPEDTTWDDSASTSVRRNRVTFLRYLTKICDQVVALISSEHAQHIVWSEDKQDDVSVDVDQDDSDRLFSFEVAQTNEQEESVKVRSGFQMTSKNIVTFVPRADCTVDPSLFKPWLIYGETVQGFMTLKYEDSTKITETMWKRQFNEHALGNLLRDSALEISENIDAKSLDNLAKLSLSRRFPGEYKRWSRRGEEAHQSFTKEVKSELNKITERLECGLPQLGRALHEELVNLVVEQYPTIQRERFQVEDKQENKVVHDESLANLSSIYAVYPKIRDMFQKAVQDSALFNIKSLDYKNQKDRLSILNLLFARHCGGWEEGKIHELINLVMDSGDIRQIESALSGKDADKAAPKPWFPKLRQMFSFSDGPGLETVAQDLVKEAKKISSNTPDPRFISKLDDIVAQQPLLQEAVSTVKVLAFTSIEKIVTQLHKTLNHKAYSIQIDECRRRCQGEANSREEEVHRQLRSDFIREINKLSKQSMHKQTLVVDSIEEVVASRYQSSSYSKLYNITGSSLTVNDPYLHYTFYVLDLTSQDRHTLQLNASYIPSPQDKFAYSFQLPMGHSIEHAQLVENEKIFLVVSDRHQIHIYLEMFTNIDAAVQRERGKTLHRDKIGGPFVLAFDEGKGSLAICSSTKLQLYMFQYEESRGAFQALGSAINLAPWYNTEVSIHHACFISGTEELVLFDSNLQARIYSFVTMQFRPASLTLLQNPTWVCSSPDGSCLFVSQAQGSSSFITAYHLSSFGSSEGIKLEITDLKANDKMLLTSLGSRNSAHLVILDDVTQRCWSYAVDITRKVTEFMFREKGNKASSEDKIKLTAHNCLVDCHADVWTRFPVLPAVQRETISTSSKRYKKILLFVTDHDHEHYLPHFANMILTFERTTRKPTGDQLENIIVSAMTFDSFSLELAEECQVSQFRAGEWLVDLLCLIPIHLAITKENRFVPLKDGVSSVELERSLLGAEVGKIVDSLSFGWYESIFASYMALKPVKVVSSMGEQSVGKSFALNHLVDTSFAGSAMRTTEGVWMSVTPTLDALIVALDFEGVHSIERSAQEDTLLVLFNTAISNMVLFRNNFALSRDITGLFQSFQSSSTVLDPSANPGLFKSTLVIIIKDVVDSDKAEIAREFSLKFQKIVQQEQGANFISRLHAGKLNIIPWPVIESREFYKLFPTVKKGLDRQTVTHRTAGEFLHTMKTLMAKLKANDWGALSQTMASHRAQLLMALLPNALAFGFAEVEPEREPLKNLDTDLLVEKPDTTSQFSLATAGSQHSASREKALSTLRSAWDEHGSRQHIPDGKWIEALSSCLDNFVDMRIDHVGEWISTNLSRFQTGHANIEELRRAFESASVDLRANVQLCKMQCATCQLLCVQSRLHDGKHDCLTNHQCLHSCEFCDETGSARKRCTMPAGHPGKHICVVNAHLCGEACAHLGKQGCLEECAKVIGHSEEDHICAASVHSCGEPCGLSRIKLADGTIYSCKGTCGIPSDRDHVKHVCDARLCPVSCQLCKRLCSNTKHLHGLERGAIHLCGQEHSCTSLCAAPGICEIDTAPHSIEATFTGRHETFQYTKYSQVAKRLKCIIPIPPGKTEHSGSHRHSLGKGVIHFCETRCENCGYFCTLPLGHPQQEHETRHGSMSQTRWAVEGPDDTSLELEGRKFSSNDDGAPMLCNLVCQSMGRHVHIDYCRSDTALGCTSAEIQHISTRMLPQPVRAKDAITHSLHWRRSGFKDPYSRDDQTNFAKCDSMCGGPEHTAAAGGASQPSYCTLPLFHALVDPNTTQAGLGYVSSDGHLFSCRNPVVMQQAFHVIFAIDRSGSMGINDRLPLQNAPAYNRIIRQANNRLGAVYSSLHSFWTARDAAATRGQQVAGRRDAYSVILFDHTITVGMVNNFASTPDQLLDIVLRYSADGGTNFTEAIQRAQALMEQNWSTDRTPVVIFLSDGECRIDDATIQDLCRSAVRLGKPLSFHAVSFGPDSSSASLRRMAQIALDVQNNAPRDPLAPAAATVLSNYTQALDSVQLAETFLGIAESLRKPRGSLLR